MKLILLYLSLFTTSLFADEIKYNKPTGLQSLKVRITKVQNHPIRLYGTNTSIAHRKLAQFKVQEMKKLFDRDKSHAIQVCTEVFKGDIGLGINENNNSVSFCLFKDDSLILIDSLNSWINKLQKK